MIASSSSRSDYGITVALVPALRDTADFPHSCIPCEVTTYRRSQTLQLGSMPYSVCLATSKPSDALSSAY